MLNFRGVFFKENPKLVCGFNPFEKYQSNWIIAPSRGENKKYLKPPTRKSVETVLFFLWNQAAAFFQ